MNTILNSEKETLEYCDKICLNEDKIADKESRNFVLEVYKKESIEDITLKDGLPQIIASCLVHCIVIQVGINMTYSTVLVEDFKRTGKLSQDEESWIASLVAITVPIGSFVSGPLMDKFGRKTIAQAACIPAIISWILLISANSINLIYISRCVAGFSGGLTTVGVIYVSEITHPRIRPMMLCCNSVFVSFGIFITCCLALWLDWLRIAIIFLVMNCIICLGLYYIPESPYWYFCFYNGIMDKKRVSKAEASLKWLNHRDKIYDMAYSRIKEVSQKREANKEDTTILQKLNYLYSQICLPTAYKPLIILFALSLLQQLSGCYVIIFYAISIFKQTRNGEKEIGSELNIYGALAMLGVVRLIMSIVAVYFSRIHGRRTLLIWSGLGMAFSMFFSGMYMYLTSSNGDENHKAMISGQQWLIIVMILFYVSTSSVGFMVIPWTLPGELLPISLKGIGSGIVVSIGYTIMFGVVKAYLYILEAIGSQGIFFIFSFMCLLATSFVFFFLPETLGKSFSEIERYFTSEKEKEREKENKFDTE